MAQAMKTCFRCGRTRYESRGKTIRFQGTPFWVCYAKTSCRVEARKARR